MCSTSKCLIYKKVTECVCRMQADMTGQRLKDLNLKYTKLINSTMKRAVETADIISQHFPEVQREECCMLREGAPISPEPPSSNWRPEKAVSDSEMCMWGSQCGYRLRPVVSPQQKSFHPQSFRSQQKSFRPQSTVVKKKGVIHPDSNQVEYRWIWS